MRVSNQLLISLSGVIPAIVFGAVSVAPTTAVAADCTFTPPLKTQTRCVKAIFIPGHPLRSFDISFVDASAGRYYLADRTTGGVDVVNTKTNAYLGTAKGFALRICM